MQHKFLITEISSILILLTFLNCTNSTESKSSGAITQVKSQEPLPKCEWCGAMDAPEELSWSTTIADENEPGERLVLNGTVFNQDGTPAAGVLIYAYHTNLQGIYEKKGDETGNGKRHGHLRGWVRTDAQGRYQFKTIKPAAYPSRSEPAHVHFTLSAADMPEYWIKSTLFDDDPLITSGMRADNDKGKFARILSLTKNDGVWVGERDIKLKK
ncbi:intradiol ring-cleavage dioxygenase [Fulvivirga lutimaris]|uniref:dioxygenase family protein n=1 Tax=Fulvivirga lutimaris TaxID=1819566 RepID=UPI0012BC7AB1|nr:intradiol ring-cleavage dioxygenase [Fulvivirga lutimaris]MTI41859.1 intradiol ring-cleavage dioxygenase [Fulvivirga lutimaris]